MTTLQRGQRLWFDSKTAALASGETTVTWIDRRGRGHLYGGYTIDPVSLLVYDRLGSLAGRCYPSEAACMLAKERDTAWRSFQQAVIAQWLMPRDLSLEELQQAQELLKLRPDQLKVDVSSKGTPSQGRLL